MIGMGCDINSRDKLGRTPLHFAAATAQYQCVLSLVANGASLTCTDKLSRTPLHYAAASDSDAKLVTRLTLQNFANWVNNELMSWEFLGRKVQMPP